MSAPKKQHYVPQCYLRAFVDPNTPPGHEPYVWVFSRNGRNKEKRAPKNIFYQTDLYTLEVNGQKHYEIEKSLAAIEADYAVVVREKITKRLPLSENEHLVLCAFVAAMMQRTLREKDNQESFQDQLIAKVTAIEQLRGLKPEKSAELCEAKRDLHKLGVIQLLPEITQLLFGMSLAFLCMDGTTLQFITSDDPVTLFNPDLQWQRLYGPGLAQQGIQVTMPVSPEVTACITWSKLRGYIRLPETRISDLNRMTRGHCYQYFVATQPKAKFIWFSRYPLHSPVFLAKILLYRVRYAIGQLMLKYRHGRFRKH